MGAVDLLTAIAQVGLVVLLYGLWQGALIALVTWGALQVFKGVNATTRYWIWSLALLAILVVPIVTTLSRVSVSTGETHQQATQRYPSSRATAITPAKTVPQKLTPSIRKASPLEALRAMLSPVLFVPLFGLWALAAFAILIRLIVAFVQLERLKSDSLPLAIEFRDAMPRFSGAAAGDRDIRICVSDKIEVPIAVGLFDSMILLPSHLVHSLDAEEIDQISLHELCHLLRGDDWTNALQRIAAGLLFFNPAMWFVSRQMDVEREVACDDFVLQFTGAVRPYAMCLTKMAEMTAWPHRALAAPGVFVTRKNISIRIERLLRTGRAIGSGIAPSALGVAAMSLLAVFFVLRTVTPSIAFTLPHATQAATVPATLKAPPPVTHSVAHSQTVTVQERVQHEVRKELHSLPKAPATVASAGCTGCNFAGADLRGRDFSHRSMEGSNFEGADLRDASFVDADMEGCNLRHAQLSGANFQGAHLTGCNIDVSGLSAEQTRTILDSCEGCNFEHANLHGVDLHGVHLTGVNLAHADLGNANLSGVMFTGVNMEYSNLAGADVNGADFTGCNFSHVDLRGVDLSHASLTGSDMATAIWK